MTSANRTHSKSSLFLIELIISLCFFSLASIVCVRLFVYAHKISTDSRRETLAIQVSQTAAECFIAADGDQAEFQRLFSLAHKNESEDIITDFTITQEPDGTGVGAAGAGTGTAGGVMCRLLIRNTDIDGAEVFSLEVLHYRQKEAPHE
ncbi:MAG: hypothetical protein IJT43_11660 [Stomatobaculum sp.]|nr:hypothetical protein [Stomatobaculum sp.]